jgi:C_GCAxxG_C_C family probable redox protein
MTAPDEAVALFNQRFNCSQSVLAACGARHGLDRRTALRLGEAFGGGMGRMGLTCGAVTGAFMTIGLVHAKLTPEDDASRQKAIALVRRFRQLFEARHGSLCCRDLIGCDLGTPEGYQQAIDSGVFTNLCPQLVHDAAAIVDELLGPGTDATPMT